MSFDKEQIRIAVALFAVALVAASLLAVANLVTREPIARAQQEALHKSLTQVLPEHHNDALKDMFVYALPEQGEIQLFPAKNNKGEVIAYAWEQVAPDGYAGSIRILMGVYASGEIVAVRVTEHRETPGLGDGITDDMAWLKRFVQQSLSSIKWAVKKDGGDFDQFTGATITPRAVVKAVHQGLKMYDQNRMSILKTLAIEEVKRLQQATTDKESGGKRQ